MLSVVMPTCRRPERLRLSLGNVAAACAREAPGAEILVVDDGGHREAAPIVHEVASRHPRMDIRLIDGGGQGRSVARNLGARESRHDRLLFIDGDMLVGREAMAMHATAHERSRRVVFRGLVLRLPWLAAVADPDRGPDSGALPGLSSRPVRLDADGYPTRDVARLGVRDRFEVDIAACFAHGKRSDRWVGVRGAHVSVPRTTFFEIGEFDPRMGRRWGAEDLELGFRLARAGIDIEQLHAVAYHMDHDSAGREQDHADALAYFANKHGEPRVLRLLDYFAGSLTLEGVFGS